MGVEQAPERVSALGRLVAAVAVVVATERLRKRPAPWLEALPGVGRVP